MRLLSQLRLILGAAILILLPTTLLGQRYVDVHDFGGRIKDSAGNPAVDGFNAPANVVFDKAGNMYSVTAFGGGLTGTTGFFGYGAGILFEITTSGTYIDLHDFGGQTVYSDGTTGVDGLQPQSLTIDSEGNLFGVTDSGGKYNSLDYGGMVWEFSNTGHYKDLHDFGGKTKNANGLVGPDGDFGMGPVTLDAAGNLYGTTAQGGGYTDGAGNIWEITKAGAYKDLHDFGGTMTFTNGQTGTDQGPCFGVSIDPKGNLFGFAMCGGYSSTQGGTIFELTTSGQYKDLHDFGLIITNANGQSGYDGVRPYVIPTLDNEGNIFGTCHAGGPYGNVGRGDISDGGMVFELTSKGQYIDLHDFGGTVINANGKSGPDGVNPMAAIVFDKFGNMFGTAYGGGPYDTTIDGVYAGMVWEITTTGKYVDLHDFGGTITLPNGTAAPDGLDIQSGMVFDAAGNGLGTAWWGGANPIPISGAQGGCGMFWKLESGVASVTVAPNPIAGGLTTTGTVTLVDAAPVGGKVVPLLSNSPLVTVPASVSVPAGLKTASFVIETSPVSTASTALISATLGLSQTASLTVNPPSLTGLTVSPTSVYGGSPSTGTIKLGSVAPTGGFVVKLSATSGTVPASVTVLAGETSATFTVTTKAVSVVTTAVVVAKVGTVSKSANLVIDPPRLVSLRLNPTTVIGGASSTATVTLTGPAPNGGTMVSLANNSTSATVPISIIVPAGQKTATFAVKTSSVTAQTVATITAVLGSVTESAKLVIEK